MQVDTRQQDDITVVSVSGAIDGSTADQLRATIINSVTPGCKLILEMHNVDFMSSAGLRVMLLLYRELQRETGQAVLVGLQQPIYDAMEATGFLKYFATAPDIQSARTMFTN